MTTITQTRPAELANGFATLRLRPEDIKFAREEKAAEIKAEDKNFEKKKRDDSNYKYKQYLPSFDDVKYPPLTEFEHHDPGLEALKHENPQEFLQGATVKHLSPKFGSEITGLKVDELDTRGRQQLALYVAQRGVVVFRDQQSFIDRDPEWLLNDWGSFFGRLHIHPTSSHPAGKPHFHLVYRDFDSNMNFEYDDRFTSSAWHSDVTYEKQPPGLTSLFLFDSPPSGGDTAYVSQVEAYNRLSPSFRAYLETLEVLHSGVDQANYSRGGKRGGVVRREPVENVHPLVRTHPVTGAKALYVNKQFSRRIIGLKREESDAILNLLYDHIAQGHDFQVRARWEPNSAVFWDNRITAHSAIVDFDSSEDGRRHGARITPQAEAPFLRK